MGMFFAIRSLAKPPLYDPSFPKIHCVQFDGVDCTRWHADGGGKACCMDVPPSGYRGYYLTCDTTTMKFKREDCGYGKVCLYKNPNECYRDEVISSQDLTLIFTSYSNPLTIPLRHWTDVVNSALALFPMT